MLVLLPLLCLPLGIVGCIIGAFVGLIADQIVLMVLFSKATVATVTGKLHPLFRQKWLFDYECVAEAALLYQALDLHQLSFTDLVSVRRWLDKKSKHIWFLKAQHSRICYELSVHSDRFDMNSLAVIIQSSSTKDAFFSSAVQFASKHSLGIDQLGLDWILRLAILINWPPDLLAVTLWEHAQLNQEAMDLMPAYKGKRSCDREELIGYCAGLVGNNPPEMVEAIRIAYKAIENQLDMIDRAIVEYSRNWQVKAV